MLISREGANYSHLRIAQAMTKVDKVHAETMDQLRAGKIDLPTAVVRLRRHYKDVWRWVMGR